MAADATIGSTKLNVLAPDQVCDQASGVALVLIGTWEKLKTVESKDPLLDIVPGKNHKTLVSLGASTERIMELELLFREPTRDKIVKCFCTAVAMSNHTFEFGTNITQISWSPAATIDMHPELDER